MYQILGKMPRDMCDECDFSEELFDNKGRIKKYKNCDYTSIKKILIDEYEFDEIESQNIQEFLMALLRYDISKRVSAKQALTLEWLN